MVLYIGNHTSSSKGYAAMGRQMLKNGGNTFAFFTRNPRGGKAKEIDPADVERFLELSRENHFGKLVAHAPYTMNACAAKENLRDFAREIMADDLKRMEYTPGNYYNFHPGSHVGQGTEMGITKIAEILNDVLTEEQSTTVLLETMSGKGSEVGATFQELRDIIDRVEKNNKLGVCLDTCHVWDGGYDIVHDLDGVLDEFDRAAAVLPYAKDLKDSELGRPTKEAAWAFSSRFALYHERWDKAVSSAEEVMTAGFHKLYDNGNPETTYNELFTLAANPVTNKNNREFIVTRLYSEEANQTHNLSRELQVPNEEARSAPTRSLMDAYLCNGLPITLPASRYRENTHEAIFNNRDPRMAQTILKPGAKWGGYLRYVRLVK